MKLLQQNVKPNIFKDIIDSITKFEKYEEFATYKFKKTILYSLFLILISSSIVSIIIAVKSFYVAKNIANEFKGKIYSIEYNDGKLVINNDNLIQINNFQIINIIIDTSIDSNENNVQEYIKNIENKENFIIFLKDECIISNSVAIIIKRCKIMV